MSILHHLKHLFIPSKDMRLLDIYHQDAVFPYGRHSHRTALGYKETPLYRGAPRTLKRALRNKHHFLNQMS